MKIPTYRTCLGADKKIKNFRRFKKLLKNNLNGNINPSMVNLLRRKQITIRGFIYTKTISEIFIQFCYSIVGYKHNNYITCSSCEDYRMNSKYNSYNFLLKLKE